MPPIKYNHNYRCYYCLRAICSADYNRPPCKNKCDDLTYAGRLLCVQVDTSIPLTPRRKHNHYCSNCVVALSLCSGCRVVKEDIWHREYTYYNRANYRKIAYQFCFECWVNVYLPKDPSLSLLSLRQKYILSNPHYWGMIEYYDA